MKARSDSCSVRAAMLALLVAACLPFAGHIPCLPAYSHRLPDHDPPAAETNAASCIQDPGGLPRHQPPRLPRISGEPSVWTG